MSQRLVNYDLGGGRIGEWPENLTDDGARRCSAAERDIIRRVAQVALTGSEFTHAEVIDGLTYFVVRYNPNLPSHNEIHPDRLPRWSISNNDNSMVKAGRLGELAQPQHAERRTTYTHRPVVEHHWLAPLHRWAKG